MPTLVIVSNGACASHSGTLNETGVREMQAAGKFVRELCDGGKQCAVLTPASKPAMESAGILCQALSVKPKRLPRLGRMGAPKTKQERPAVATIRSAIQRQPITVVVLPACDLPTVLHAFIGSTAGCRQKTGKIVWIDTDKKVHSVL